MSDLCPAVDTSAPAGAHPGRGIAMVVTYGPLSWWSAWAWEAKYGVGVGGYVSLLESNRVKIWGKSKKVLSPE